MEKLLHERLREIAEKLKGKGLYEGIGIVSDMLGIEPKGSYFNELREIVEHIANDIERTYAPNGDLDEIFADWIEHMAKGDIELPKIRAAIDKWCVWRPRFEDGEPVQFGDRFTNQRGEGQTATSFTYTKGEGEYVSVNGFFRQKLGEPVKRTTSKIYDADGVETKAGDEGFDVKTGCEMTVLFVQPDDDEYALFVLCKDGTEIHLQADQFTHERPVFDEEGVRICKGDTVWGTLLHDKHEVSLVKNGCVYLDDGSICFESTQLTNREPDSYQKAADQLEAIIDDSDELIDTEWTLKLKEVHERFAALIESGA